jgi:hypothetical protein
MLIFDGDYPMAYGAIDLGRDDNSLYGNWHRFYGCWLPAAGSARS